MERCRRIGYPMVWALTGAEGAFRSLITCRMGVPSKSDQHNGSRRVRSYGSVRTSSMVVGPARLRLVSGCDTGRSLGIGMTLLMDRCSRMTRHELPGYEGVRSCGEFLGVCCGLMSWRPWHAVVKPAAGGENLSLKRRVGAATCSHRFRLMIASFADAGPLLRRPL